MNWKQRYAHDEPWKKVHNWENVRFNYPHPDFNHFNQTATGGDYFPHAGELSSEDFEGKVKPQLSGENLRRHLAEHPNIMEYRTRFSCRSWSTRFKSTYRGRYASFTRSTTLV